MTKIAIIGCGLIGQAWAISFARGGCSVALWDAKTGAAAACLKAIPKKLADLHSNKLLSEKPESILLRISVCSTLEEAVRGASHVQENTPEDVECKRQIFGLLDAAAPADTVLSSSTSGLLPSSFTEDLDHRERCLVAHPINPPYLVPAVEIVPAPWTDESVVERTRALLSAIGQKPITMTRELPGFVMNRLQGALLEEAFRLVDEGYASAEEVDVGIRDGLALRWSFMGPFETIDLNAPDGIRDYVARYGEMYRHISLAARHRADWTGPVLDQIEAERRQVLSAENLGQRQAWRDRRLMALIGHKMSAETEEGK